MNFQTIAITTGLLIGSFRISAQAPNIMISDIADPNEISIALNPKDGTKMMAGANIASVYTSESGGISWKRLTQYSTLGVWGDPVMVIDTAEHYFHFHLSRPDSGNWVDRIVCQKSDDFGKTFNNGTFAGLNGTKVQDKPWIAVNSKTNEMYVTWTQFDKYESADPDDRSNIHFSKSIDSGNSWSVPIQINSVDGDCLDDDNTVEGAVPAVGPNGEIYVAWAGPAGLSFNKSLDNGKTWLEHEIKIDSIVGGWAFDIPGIYRANGMPITKCDISDSPNRGTIYVNWIDSRNGDHDVWLSKSTNEGQTWSKAIKVNQDKSKRDQFFTWMDLDQSNGNLYFVYHDRRNHSGDSTDVYLSFSTDGGNSFKDVRISDSPFLPNNKIFFGDYNNISASNGIVRPVWTRLDRNHLSVWTAIVETQTLLNPENERLEAVFKNGKLNLQFKGKYKGGIALRDLNQKVIAEWKNQKIKRKGLTISPKERMDPGVYFVRISNSKNSFERQLIIPEK